jgi:hypothetical protein
VSAEAPERLRSGVHVIQGGTTACALEQAFGHWGLSELLLVLSDPLDLGPLWDLEDGGARRSAFWAHLGVSPAPNEDDEETWRVIESAPIVTVWHGPHIEERLAFLRVAALADRVGRDIHEITWTAGQEKARRIATRSMVTATIADLMAQRAMVGDLAALASAWDAVSRSRVTIVRRLDGEEIEESSARDVDDLVLGSCRNIWTPEPLICFLARGTFARQLLQGRLRVLLAEGRLAVRSGGWLGFREFRAIERGRRRP